MAELHQTGHFSRLVIQKPPLYPLYLWAPKTSTEIRYSWPVHAILFTYPSSKLENFLKTWHEDIFQNLCLEKIDLRRKTTPFHASINHPLLWPPIDYELLNHPFLEKRLPSANWTWLWKICPTLPRWVSQL